MYIEGLGDAATVDIYKEYVKCVSDKQSQQVQSHANNNNVSNTKTSQKITKSMHGIEYDLYGCNREGRNNLVCDFVLTSKFRDRTINIAINWRHDGSKIYDDFGEKFKANEIISNSGEERYLNYHISLIADVTVKILVKFSNISTRSRKIKKFLITPNIQLILRDFVA